MKHNDKNNHHKKHDHKNNKHHEHNSNDHANHHKHMITDFRIRFWISLAISIPILVLSSMIQKILGFTFSFHYDHYVLFILSTIVFFYGGWPFLKGLVNELKKKEPGMMTLIAVAITVAWAYSSATTFGLEGKSFFWELAALIDVMLLGHWIEMESVVGASQSLQKLVELMPSEANLIKEDDIKTVKIEELSEEDKVLVQPGEKIPVDGKIYEGNSHVNESMVTGESKPVKKDKGSKVIGGTINGSSSLKISVEQVGDKAYLNRVVKIVKAAQEKKSKTQNFVWATAYNVVAIPLAAGVSIAQAS